jgi:hypothetical protein
MIIFIGQGPCSLYMKELQSFLERISKDFLLHFTCKVGHHPANYFSHHCLLPFWSEAFPSAEKTALVIFTLSQDVRMLYLFIAHSFWIYFYLFLAHSTYFTVLTSIFPWLFYFPLIFPFSLCLFIPPLPSNIINWDFPMYTYTLFYCIPLCIMYIYNLSPVFKIRQ